MGKAVHLNIVPDMTTAVLIRSLKRFASCRVLPKKFVSDNSKSFKVVVESKSFKVVVAQSIKTTMNSEEVQHYLAGVGVEWSFNLERAPLWGVEHMVQMTKRCMPEDDWKGQANL